MVIWNLIIVNNNHLVFKKEKPVGPTNFIARDFVIPKSSWISIVAYSSTT
jgi:hypothetical protein